MSTYTLTNTEVWALSTLVYLPINQDSILGQWLSAFDTPDLILITSSAVNTLSAKGIIDPGRGADIIPQDLLEGLLALALSGIRLTTAIQRSGRYTWAHFCQQKEIVVQYETNGDTIQIHSPDKAYDLPALLIPNWFNVSAQENFNDTLPLGAYIMLATAFQEEDIQSVLDADGYNITLSRNKLIDAFIQSQEWVDIYHALGIPGIQPAAQMPIKEYLDNLLQRGYLQQASADGLSIGPRAAPLREAYRDPDRCTLTISIDGTGAYFPPTGALIYGNGRLFLTQVFESGQYSVQQLNHYQTAAGWVSNLIARGAAIQHTLPPPPAIAAPSYSPPVYPQPAPGYEQVRAPVGQPMPPQNVPAYPPAAPPQPGYQPAYYAAQPGGYQQPPSYTPPPAAYQQPPKKKNSCCLIIVVIGVLIALCAAVTIGGVMLLDIDLTNILNINPETPAGKAPIWVVNNSTVTVCYLYASPSNSEEWGNDILGNATVEPGDTWKGWVDLGVTVDLAALDCSENLIDIQYGVTITSEGITYTLDPISP